MLILQNIDIYLIFNILQKKINTQEIDSSDFTILFSFKKTSYTQEEREKNKHIKPCLFCKQ
jgi:hypothetical protein